MKYENVVKSVHKSDRRHQCTKVMAPSFVGSNTRLTWNYAAEDRSDGAIELR